MNVIMSDVCCHISTILQEHLRKYEKGIINMRYSAVMRSACKRLGGDAGNPAFRNIKLRSLEEANG